MTDALSATFSALADPTRRAILARLSRGATSVTELARPFTMSQPAISKHLKVLERAHLIERTRSAQWRPCRLAPKPLQAADNWLAGYRQHWEDRFDRLEAYLKDIKQETAMTTPAEAQAFTISRVFDAPRPLVYGAFTDPKRMQHWWGPKGFKVIRSDMDLRPGGVYHYGLKAADGSLIWGKFVYREIVPPQRVVLINSFSDENAGITHHPLMADWPLELISTFTFEEVGLDQTRFTVRWEPYKSTDAEIAAFNAGHDSMTGGWTGTLDQLAAYLKTQQNP